MTDVDKLVCGLLKALLAQKQFLIKLFPWTKTCIDDLDINIGFKSR